MAGETKIQLADLHAAQRDAVIAFGDPPAEIEGRGIVTTIYDREFASAWVLLNEIARLKIRLPVEAWHRPGELSERHLGLVRALDLDLRICMLADPVEGWAIKPSAIRRSRFREVLWIDCDNFPIRDVAFLFDDAEYRQKGSLFWRDVSGADRAMTWHPKSPVWQVFDVPFNDAEEFESGQLLIDKGRCWKELGLTLHYNLRGDVYHRYVYGDKDTFRLAWQNLAAKKGGAAQGANYLADPAKVPYGFMPFGPFHMGRPNPWHKWGGGSVMVQRDRKGAPIFNHRNLCKFRLGGPNPVNDDVLNEAIYHQHLAALTRRLAGPIAAS